MSFFHLYPQTTLDVLRWVMMNICNKCWLRTAKYKVSVAFGQTFSTPFLPGASLNSSGGSVPCGNASSSREIEEKFWRRRMSMKDISLYAYYKSYKKSVKWRRVKWRTCWPKQIRGPALKGRKMNEFLMRYFLTRSSRKRSGSNSSAANRIVSTYLFTFRPEGCLTIRSPKVFSSMHHEDRIHRPGASGNVVRLVIGIRIGPGSSVYTLAIELVSTLSNIWVVSLTGRWRGR